MSKVEKGGSVFMKQEKKKQYFCDFFKENEERIYTLFWSMLWILWILAILLLDIMLFQNNLVKNAEIGIKIIAVIAIIVASGMFAACMIAIIIWIMSKFYDRSYEKKKQETKMF